MNSELHKYFMSTSYMIAELVDVRATFIHLLYIHSNISTLYQSPKAIN